MWNFKEFLRKPLSTGFSRSTMNLNNAKSLRTCDKIDLLTWFYMQKPETYK